MTQRRRLVVHLGFPKTGSTTIQGMLSRNSAGLGPGIVASPKDDLTYLLRKNALRYMRSGRFPLWMWRYDRALADMVRAVDAMAFDTLIISDENMIGIESGKLFDPGQRDYAGRLAKFDRAFAAYDVTYVVYTREVTSWQASAYNQAFKMRRIRQSFSDWLGEHHDLTGPERILGEFREVVGERLRVVDMHSETGGDRLLGVALLEIAGVTPERIAALTPPPRQNESLPAAMIELLRLIHENRLLRPGKYHALMKLLRQHPELLSRDVKLTRPDDGG